MSQAWNIVFLDRFPNEIVTSEPKFEHRFQIYDQTNADQVVERVADALHRGHQQGPHYSGCTGRGT